MKEEKSSTATLSHAASAGTTGFFVGDSSVVGITVVATTSSCTGTYKVQISNDNSTWIDYTISPSWSALADASANFYANLGPFGFEWVRVFFTTGGGANGSGSIKFVKKVEY